MASSKETAAKVQDLLTLCLAKAFDTSLSAAKGPDWFAQFKKEEEEERFPIPRSYQTSIYDCDFQALLKILYYRPEYAKLILKYYRRSDELAGSERPSPFRRTLGRLINDYRNDIAAHVSAKKIRENFSGNEESIYYDYPDAIRDMTSIAKVFEAVKDENGKSYYEQIKKTTAPKTKHWLYIGIGAAVLIIAVVVLLLIRPWNHQSVSSDAAEKTEAAIDKRGGYSMNHDIALEISEEFFRRIKTAASAADRQSFGEYFDPDVYSEEEISNNYQLLSDNLDRYEYVIDPLAFTDDQICAMQLLYSADGKETGTFVWFLSRTKRGWKISSADSALRGKYDQEMREIFGSVYAKGYCNTSDYQIVFQSPVFQGLNAKLRSLYKDERGRLIAEIMIFNGSGNDINSISFTGMEIVNRDTGEKLVTVSTYGNRLSEPITNQSCRYISVDVSDGAAQNAAWIAPLLQNGSLDLTDQNLNLALRYELLSE